MQHKMSPKILLRIRIFPVTVVQVVQPEISVGSFQCTDRVWDFVVSISTKTVVDAWAKHDPGQDFTQDGLEEAVLKKDKSPEKIFRKFGFCNCLD